MGFLFLFSRHHEEGDGDEDSACGVTVTRCDGGWSRWGTDADAGVRERRTHDVCMMRDGEARLRAPEGGSGMETRGARLFVFCPGDSLYTLFEVLRTGYRLLLVPKI